MGDIVSRFGSLQQLRELLTTSLIEALIDGLMASAVLVLLFVYQPVLAAVVLTAVLLYALMRLIFYAPLKQCTEQSIVAQAKEQSSFMESIRAIQSLQLFSKQSQRLSLWQNQYSTSVDQHFRLGRWQISLQAVHQLLFGIEHIIVIEGTIEVLLGGTWQVVRAGNGLRFNADQPHGYRNLTSKIARFHNIIHYPETVVI